MCGYNDNFLNLSFRSNCPKISSSGNYWNPRNCKTWLTRQTSLWRRVEHPPTRSWWSSSSSSSSKWSRQSAPLSSKSKINLTPKVIVLHREYTQGGSIGVTLAGGADYESKEITVIHHLSVQGHLKQFSMVIYMRVYPQYSLSGAQGDRRKPGGPWRSDPERRSSSLDQWKEHEGGQP